MSGAERSAEVVDMTRAHDVRRVVETFMSTFKSPDIDEQEFLAIYHPELQWYDHAFQIQRQGKAAVLGLKRSFLHCNQPFSGTIEVSHFLLLSK